MHTQMTELRDPGWFHNHFSEERQSPNPQVFYQKKKKINHEKQISNETSFGLMNGYETLPKSL